MCLTETKRDALCVCGWACGNISMYFQRKNEQIFQRCDLFLATILFLFPLSFILCMKAKVIYTTTLLDSNVIKSSEVTLYTDSLSPAWKPLQLFCSSHINSGFTCNLPLVYIYHDFKNNVHTTKMAIRPSNGLCVASQYSSLNCSPPLYSPLSSVIGLSKTLQGLWSQTIPFKNNLFTRPYWGRRIWSQAPHETPSRVNKSLLRLCRGDGELFYSDHKNPKTTKVLYVTNPLAHSNHLLVVLNCNLSKNQATDTQCYVHFWILQWIPNCVIHTVIRLWGD